MRNLTRRGHGIFIAINQFEGARKDIDVTKIRALFFDSDDGPRGNYPLKPSFKVQSAQGPHGYYLLEDELPVELFKPLQKMIAKVWKTDSNGKGVLTAVLTGLLGQENVSAVP